MQYQRVDIRVESQENTENIFIVSCIVIGPVDQRWFDEASDFKMIINHRSKKFEKFGKMLPETRAILTRFYKPHNEKLADLLGDDRFLWQ